MKTVDFDFNLLQFDNTPIADPAYKWVQMILGASSSQQESQSLKIFGLHRQLTEKKAIQLDEADEQSLKKLIESFNQVDHFGNPRVNAFMKAQLFIQINKQTQE
jgi:hypothetical protein